MLQPEWAEQYNGQCFVSLQMVMTDAHMVICYSGLRIFSKVGLLFSNFLLVGRTELSGRSYVLNTSVKYTSQKVI